MLLPALAALILLALSACDEAAEPPFLPEATIPAAPTGELGPRPSPSPAPPAAIRSYADPHDFKAFGRRLAAAIDKADLQFFLDNTTFQQLSCANEFTRSPFCEGRPLETSFRGISVGFWQSEGGGLTDTEYQNFIRDFLTNFDAGLSDAYGDGKTQLYAYAVFRPELNLASAGVETVYAAATRIAGPLRDAAMIRGGPSQRGVVLLGAGFDGRRWSIANLIVGPPVFLNPTSPDATQAAVKDAFEFWERWEGSK